MDKHELGRFFAKSFDDNIIEFVVYDDKTMNCTTLGIKDIKRIILKPRFILIGEESFYTHKAKAEKKYQSAPGLICEYDIHEDLFNYMRENKMIDYSTDMAYLYGFSDTKGYDQEGYHVGNPYKRAKKKGPILVKQKRGEFN